MKIFSGILFFMLSFFSQFSFAHGNHADNSPPSHPILGQSIFNLNSKWLNQDGKPISFQELRGKPALIAMIYTSCDQACPMIVEDIKKIEQSLPEKTRANFSFYLFSFDPDRDSPEKLKAFSLKHKLNLKQWSLFHGDSQGVRELALILGVQYKRLANKDFDHSNLISLIDSEGLIAYQQSGLNQSSAEILAKMNNLASTKPVPTH